MTSVHLSDAEALAAAPRNITLRAMPGCAIVWFLPYQTDGGVIELPENATPQSVNGLIIDDATGHGLPPGTKVVVSRVKGDGVYFEVEGTRFCRIKREGLILIDETAAA